MENKNLKKGLIAPLTIGVIIFIIILIAIVNLNKGASTAPNPKEEPAMTLPLEKEETPKEETPIEEETPVEEEPTVEAPAEEIPEEAPAEEDPVEDEITEEETPEPIIGYIMVKLIFDNGLKTTIVKEGEVGTGVYANQLRLETEEQYKSYKVYITSISYGEFITFQEDTVEVTFHLKRK